MQLSTQTCVDVRQLNRDCVPCSYRARQRCRSRPCGSWFGRMGSAMLWSHSAWRCLHMHIHAQIATYIPTCMHACICLNSKFLEIFIRMNLTHIHTSAHVHTYTHNHKHADMQGAFPTGLGTRMKSSVGNATQRNDIRIHTYIHTYIHMHTHMCRKFLCASIHSTCKNGSRFEPAPEMFRYMLRWLAM